MQNVNTGPSIRKVINKAVKADASHEVFSILIEAEQDGDIDFYGGMQILFDLYEIPRIDHPIKRWRRKDR